MIKKVLATLVLFVAFFTSKLHADEGMWLPYQINDALYNRMQQMGLSLSPDQIFSFNKSSLKDAIVSFGGGCTGEIISPEGLLLTNHHCGYSRIQMHSTPENDYLKDGFWAMSRQEELPNPGLFVTFLVSVTDVTSQINSVINDNMSRNERNRAILDKSNQIVKEATQGTHYTGFVRAMFAGNEYYLFINERYNDVRLVGAPPSSIGKFGGDTDNWMWPRHTGDFAIFRVYSGPDGKPAEYSPENIPLKPRHYLPVSIKGVQEGDFTMIMGYPGSTDRYLTSFGIEFKLQHELPLRIDIRRRKLDIIEQAMASGAELRIKYASKQSGISNYWKNFIGMSEALKRHNVAQTKREMEANFTNWVNSETNRKAEYGNLLEQFRSAYVGFEKFHSYNFIHAEAVATGADVIPISRNFVKLASLLKEGSSPETVKEEANRIRLLLERLYRNFDTNVDRQLWAAMMETYNSRVPAHLKPAIFNEINRKYRGDYNRFAAEVYRKSIFASRQNLERFLDNPKLKTIHNDWVFRMSTALYDKFDEISAQVAEYDDRLAIARRQFVKGLREMDPDGMFYPDANSTMRLTFGRVASYRPKDAVIFDYITTTNGITEKEDPSHHEFVVPQELTQLISNQQFGKYGSNGQMVVNFISGNDITGGNSGSPVIDGNGYLIGLAFDGNWEAMSGDILFEHNTQRSINVDARYILFVIDKVAGAGHLLNEMTIIQ